MKQTLVVVALLATLAVAACGHPPPPAPPPPPGRPGHSAARPPPTTQAAAAPVVDEYTRLKAMASDEIDRLGLLGEIHFDYDKADLREGDRAVLAKNAEVLKKFDFLKVTLEGHCDERGTVEYNLALGERRARVAYDYVVSLGVPADRLKTVSYGKEIQVCNDANEACWQRNRRAKFTVTGKTSR